MGYYTWHDYTCLLESRGMTWGILQKSKTCFICLVTQGIPGTQEDRRSVASSVLGTQEESLAKFQKEDSLATSVPGTREDSLASSVLGTQEESLAKFQKEDSLASSVP